MLGEDSIFQLLNLLYVVLCLMVMTIGVAVTRSAPTARAVRVRMVENGFVLTLAGAFVAFFVGSKLVAFLGGGAVALYVAGFYVAFAGGTVLELIESDPARFKRGCKAFFLECARQWGKVPTSH